MTFVWSGFELLTCGCQCSANPLDNRVALGQLCKWQ